jgi:hypothetical protein
MTSKKDLIGFTRSFPGADAQILGRMTNSYVTGDTIEYKTITVKDSSNNRRDVNITNNNNKLNVTGSLNVSQDIKCQTANINNVFALDIKTGIINTDILVSKELLVNELVKTKVLVADAISTTGILCKVIRATGVECEAILMGKNEISYTGDKINITGNLNVSQDIKTQTANINNVFALDIHSGVITSDILVVSKELLVNELVKTKVLVADAISTTGILCNVIRATGVECEGILMGTNEISYTGNNLNINNNLTVNGELNSGLLHVDTSIVANNITTNYNKCSNLTVDNILSTPSIQIGNTRIYANSFNLEIKETIDYDKTVIVTSRTDGKLTYGDRIFFVGINGFRGTLEITEIKPDNLYVGTMHNIITTMESVITSYGIVEISPLIINGKLTDFSIIGANNVITGGTNLYLGINGVMGLGSWTNPGSFTIYISGFATTNLTPLQQ